MELVNASTSETLKVLKYTAPSKFTAVKINLNGEEVEARFTSARGKEYTYFPLNGVSVYVAGKLEEGGNYTVEVPQDFKGPAWDGARKSYYVRKRPVKEPGGDDPIADGRVGNPAATTGSDVQTEGKTNAQSDNQAESGETGSTDGSGDASGAGEATTQVEGSAAEGGVTEAPKSRRRRAE